MSEENTQAISVKELAVFVPAIGSALALTYNVGYFWSLDIKMFTMFSLAEHLVFALESLPLATMIAVLAMFSIGSFRIGQKHSQENAEIEDRLIAAKAITTDDVEKRKRSDRRLLLAMAGAGVITGGTAIWAGTYITGSLLVASSIYCILYLLSSIVLEPPILQMCMGFSALILTFAAGVQVQTGEYRSDRATHSIKLEETFVEGKLVRSGERGLLFIQAQPKQIRFLKWDKVSEVVTLPSKTTPVATQPQPTVPQTSK
jgi:hypothetical protein